MINIGGLHLGWRRKLPMILQTEASECGLASVAMIAHYHGYHADLTTIRRRFGSSLKGATLRDLVGTSDELGFISRPLRLELEELGQLNLPCILHWDLNHFVVLATVGRDGATIHDPAVGVRKFSEAELSRHFTGIALELRPTARFEAAEAPPRIRMSQLLGRMSGLKQTLFHLIILALALEVFAMITPLLLSWVVDDAVVSGDRDLLTTLALAFSVMLLLQMLVSTMRNWTLMGLNASAKVHSRSNLFSHLMNLPASFFDARHLGDIMSRFSSQETILQAITSELVEAILDGTMAIITLFVMFAFAPKLAVIVVLGAALYALLRWGSYVPLRQASSEAIVWAARRDTHFLESLRGIRTIKIFNAQDERRVHWSNLLVETINRQLTADKLRLIYKTAKMALLGGINILVIWLGARQVLDGQLSVGLLLAFIAYKNLFLERVSELVNKAVDLRMLRLHAERLADIALTAPEASNGRNSARRLRSQKTTLELRNVSFRYSENEPWVLEKISFQAQAGESVAIVGASGCGKTTLLKILCGLLQPNQGEILINGEPVSRLGLDNYRAMLGVVLQDDHLFGGSLSDNISFFAESIDQNRIEHCAKLAAVHEDIIAMPMGYGTLIGDMGTVLSGGQKQRVLIARALYRQPALLLLDEATSHLDVPRERHVNQALRSLKMLQIIIAHRPDTILASDRIIALQNGQIVDNGDATTRAAIANQSSASTYVAA